MKEEINLAITYLEGIIDKFVEGNGYERHPLPEYYAIETALKFLKQEECEDAISRAEVLKQIDEWRNNEFVRVTNPCHYLKKRVSNMPPVKLIRKDYWIMPQQDDGETKKKLNEIESIFDEMKKEISAYKTGELKDLETDEMIDIVLEIIEDYKIKIT